MVAAKKIFALIAFILPALACHAKSAAICVVQHGIDDDKVCEQTLVAEDAVMDFLFTRGNIVTNEPAISSRENDDSETWRRALFDAQESGARFFALVSLFYDRSASRSPDSVMLSHLSSVSLVVADARDGEKIADTGKMKVAVQGKDGAENVKKYFESVAALIQSAMEARR